MFYEQVSGQYICFEDTTSTCLFLFWRASHKYFLYCIFKEAFEEQFGECKSIPQPNATRWNSTFEHIASVLKLDFHAVNDMLESTTHRISKFTAREWSQLEELRMILEPFLEATQSTEGQKVCGVMHYFLEDVGRF